MSGRERNATRGVLFFFFLRNFTHRFVCNELVGEQLDWWMAVTCGDQCVFRVCVHELREGRVDEACVRIDRLSSVRLRRKGGLMYIPFRRTKPSTTGVTLAVEWPISMTNAEPFPAANLV